MGSTSSTDSIVSIEIIPSRHRTFTSTTSLASVDIIPVAGAVSTAKGREVRSRDRKVKVGRTWSA